jgi:dihydroxy-acid dehydratase
VISADFATRYLSNPGREGVFEGAAVVFDGAEDYRARINDPQLDIHEGSILVIRGAGPLGWPGSAEVVNMQPPDRLLRRGINSLPTIGDGRQSGTSNSPSILNASPESAAGGGLAWLRTGDTIRIDMNARRCDMLVDDEELNTRKQSGPPPLSADGTPWQSLYRKTVGQLSDGACIEDAVRFRRIAKNLPRHNH